MNDYERVRPYLFKAVRNEHLKLIEEESSRNKAFTTFSTLPEYHPPHQSAETQLLINDCIAIVNRAIAVLTPRTQTVFNLYWHHKLSREHIAQQLNITFNLVRRELEIAYQAAAEALGAHRPHPEETVLPAWGFRYFRNPSNNVPPEIIARYLIRNLYTTDSDTCSRYGITSECIEKERQRYARLSSTESGPRYH